MEPELQLARVILDMASRDAASTGTWRFFRRAHFHQAKALLPSYHGKATSLEGSFIKWRKRNSELWERMVEEAKSSHVDPTIQLAKAMIEVATRDAISTGEWRFYRRRYYAQARALLPSYRGIASRASFLKWRKNNSELWGKMMEEAKSSHQIEPKRTVSLSGA